MWLLVKWRLAPRLMGQRRYRTTAYPIIGTVLGMRRSVWQCSVGAAPPSSPTSKWIKSLQAGVSRRTSPHLEQHVQFQREFADHKLIPRRRRHQFACQRQLGLLGVRQPSGRQKRQRSRQLLGANGSWPGLCADRTVCLGRRELGLVGLRQPGARQKHQRPRQLLAGGGSWPGLFGDRAVCLGGKPISVGAVDGSL